MKAPSLIPLLLLSLSPSLLAAGSSVPLLDATDYTLGSSAIVVFVVAYIAVIGEEFIHLRKSKPVILAAGVIWALVAIIIKQKGLDPEIEKEMLHNMKHYLDHTLVEFAELFLFLLVAMTYINAMTARRVFDSLKSWLTNKGYSFKQLFWITGVLSFFISPVADNLTTAMIMGTVIRSLAGDNKKFVTLCFINIVIAANAGGAFSPFGDITTLMVWQKEKISLF
ncbi:MAG: sodium:proton antiporter NhaD, partial [Lentisphaeraceae bacterium]|nr:sodium:proton antiporter NhaD [Lentisphaeraceae bacterium]